MKAKITNYDVPSNREKQEYFTTMGDYKAKNIYSNILTVHGQIPNTTIVDPNAINDTLVYYITGMDGTPFVVNTDEYKMSIFRFDIATSYVPLRIVVLRDPGISFVELDDSITLSFGGFDVQTFLQWIPENNTTSQPTLVSQLAYTDYYFLYSYQHWVKMVNIAFQTAFAALSGLVGLPTTVPPAMYYDAEAKKFHLIMDSTYINDAINIPSAGIQIFFNGALHSLHYNYPWQETSDLSVNGKDYLLRVSDDVINIYDQTGVNPKIYYNPYAVAVTPYASVLVIIRGEYQVMGSFTNIASISFRTTLPVSNEIISPPITNFGSTQVNSNTSGGIPLLTDFSISEATEAVGSTRQILNFSSNIPRYIDLSGRASVTQVELNVYFTTTNGEIRPLFFNDNGFLSMKLGFIHQSNLVW